MARNLPDHFRNPCPTLADRRRLSTDAMEFWSVEGWRSWLVDGAGIANDPDPGNHVLAFCPLTLEPHDTEAKYLPYRMKHVYYLPDSYITRMEEGLAACFQNPPWEKGTSAVCFLIELAGFTDGTAPRAAFMKWLSKANGLQNHIGEDHLANSIAFVLSKHIEPSAIRDVLPAIEPLILLSATAAVLVAAKLAIDEPELYGPRLQKWAPQLYASSVMGRGWNFAVRKLTEFSPENVAQALASDDNLRRAEIEYRSAALTTAAEARPR